MKTINRCFYCKPVFYKKPVALRKPLYIRLWNLLATPVKEF